MKNLKKKAARALSQLANKLDPDEETLERLEEVENNIDLIIGEIGELAAHCDKCESRGCTKCNGTGVVTRKQLFGWPW